MKSQQKMLQIFEIFVTFRFPSGAFLLARVKIDNLKILIKCSNVSLDTKQNVILQNNQ